MIRPSTRPILFPFCLAALLLSTQTTRADELDDLKSQAAARDPQIQALKRAGTVGETYLGYLDVPKSATPDERKLMDAENADRKRLYQLLAQKNGTPIETVADRAAKRNFRIATKGELLKLPDGTWHPKE